jgi:putative DNA primase/helicase
VAILVPPSDKPDKWDAADAVAEGFDCAEFVAQGERRVVKAALPMLPTFTLGALLDDDSPLPPDLISPRVLTPAGMLVFGGAPKVGKSDFLLAWLTHMAAGAAFLGMHPPRPLRVFYLQAEVQYHYLRERVKEVRIPASRLLDARANFVATPQLRLVLDDAGLAQVIPAIANAFGGEPPDIIAIDPIRNVFDGGDAGGENDNGAMLFFLSQRVDRIRQAVNPTPG